MKNLLLALVAAVALLGGTVQAENQEACKKCCKDKCAECCKDKKCSDCCK